MEVFTVPLQAERGVDTALSIASSSFRHCCFDFFLLFGMRSSKRAQTVCFCGAASRTRRGKKEFARAIKYNQSVRKTILNC